MGRISAAIVSLGILILASSAASQDSQPPNSQCIAMAQALPGAAYANLTPETAGKHVKKAAMGGTVDIMFAGHSTYVITTPGGVTIATDYNGWSGGVKTPRVVTMNQAHSSHYTQNPDPAIEHVLKGWGDNTGPADHDVVVDDVYIRNVTTDIRSFGTMAADANSIFIFEVADLCIGHLGHLHHQLEDRHYAQIGRLDILMVPVDGGLTLSHETMTAIARRLQSSILLPMHRRGSPLSSFIERMGDKFVTDYVNDDHFGVSLQSLPRRPTIMVLKGV